MANTPNYVKFMRGTEALFNSLAIKDNDTLYFIFQEGQENRGKLYLGNRLISGSFSDGSGVIDINDLENVFINTAELADHDILVYNAATQKWENADIEEFLMVGATAENAGVSGLVPAPNTGDQSKFLRGDGTWAEVSTSGLTPEERQKILDLDSAVSTLVGSHTGQSIDAIVESIIVQAGAPENLDTIKEISDWIQQHPNDVAEINSSIADLQERVSTLEGNDFTSLESRVLNLESAVGDLEGIETKYVNVSTQLDHLTSELNDRLRWHELSE